MIAEDYVSFETAKLLKEKGFDENCATLYDLRNGELREKQTGYVFNNSQWDNFVTAPTLQMAMKWLRESHSLEIYPYHDFTEDNDSWWFEIIRFRSSYAEYESDSMYLKYETACDAAIKYCLENLI